MALYGRPDAGTAWKHAVSLHAGLCWLSQVGRATGGGAPHIAEVPPIEETPVVDTYLRCAQWPFEAVTIPGHKPLCGGTPGARGCRAVE